MPIDNTSQREVISVRKSPCVHAQISAEFASIEKVITKIAAEFHQGRLYHASQWQ